jgi:hypothetical protein
LQPRRELRRDQAGQLHPAVVAQLRDLRVAHGPDLAAASSTRGHVVSGSPASLSQLGAGRGAARLRRVRRAHDRRLRVPRVHPAELRGGDRRRGRSYSLEIGEDRSSAGWVQFYGSYRDEYARFEGAWRFARRQYQTLARGAVERMQAFPLEDRPREPDPPDARGSARPG